MKKTILTAVLFLAVFSISCKKDDDGDDSSTSDVVVGTWSLEQKSTNTDSNNLSDCEKKNTITFSNDNEYSSISFQLQQDESCKDLGSLSGTWKNNENNKYTITLNIEEGQRKIETIITVKDDILTLTYGEAPNTVNEIYKKQ